MSNNINFHGNAFQNDSMNHNKIVNVGKANNSSTNTTNSYNLNCNNSSNDPTSSSSSHHYHNNDNQQQQMPQEMKHNNQPSSHYESAITEEGIPEYQAQQPGANGVVLDSNNNLPQQNINQGTLNAVNYTNDKFMEQYAAYAIGGGSNATSKRRDACNQYPYRHAGAVLYCDDYVFYRNKINFIYKKHGESWKVHWVLKQLELNKNDKKKMQSIYINVCKSKGEPLF